MRKTVRIAQSCLAGGLALSPAPAPAQMVILHTFVGGAGDGQYPTGTLLQVGSTFYGMTTQGGTGYTSSIPTGDGTIFQIGTDGTGYSLMHTFGGPLFDGRNPYGSLTQIGSFLYGTTFAGGGGDRGTIFQIGADGTNYGVRYNFIGGANDGAYPFGSLVSSGSTLYGGTRYGASTVCLQISQNGAVFQFGTDGSGYSLLHPFTGSPGDGLQPGNGAPVQSGTNLYGTTTLGGNGNMGTIYQIGTDGTNFNLLHSFTGTAGGDGQNPYGSLIQVGSTLYGMTYSGGTAGDGAIFEIGTDGTGYRVLHSFAGGPGDGAFPTGGLLLNGSMLYGMTSQGGADTLGTIFGIGIDGADYSVLHSFAGGANDGSTPNGDLLTDGSTLYGMTEYGGLGDLGTIFSFAIPVPEPSFLILMAGGGAVAFIGRRRRITAGTAVAHRKSHLGN